MIPEEINPLNWKEYQKPNLLYQKHGIVLISPIQQVQPHNDSIHRNHHLSQPAKQEVVSRNIKVIQPVLHKG